MRFSIVTISYNQAQYLERAIESVVEQRAEGLDIEYIVVDAGSTDGSSEILEKHRANIDCLIMESDKGPADGLNKGFAQATGSFWGFLNADDCLEPGSLSAVGAFFEGSPECGAVVGAIEILIDGSNSRPRVVIPAPFTLSRYEEERTSVLQQATFFRREAWDLVDGFNISNSTCWDGELFVDMLIAGVRFCRISEVLGTFRVHSASITGTDRLAQQYALDSDRIRARIRASEGHRLPASRYRVMSSRIRRLTWKARPMVRLRETQLMFKRYPCRVTRKSGLDESTRRAG